MLTLLLADAELERVPQSITGHQQVVTAARRVGVRPNKMLLDSSLHYAALRSIEDGARRGRPDLVHLFLLTALESIANKAGHVRVLVHTREDNLIRVDSTTRLVRNYPRFCGLIQQLFEVGTVPHDTPLLRLESGWKVLDVAAKAAADRVVILDERSAHVAPWDVFTPQDSSRHTLAIIGGFPSGTFRSPLPAGERVSFGRTQLTVWTVAAELLVNYERAAKIRSADAESESSPQAPPAP